MVETAPPVVTVPDVAPTGDEVADADVVPSVDAELVDVTES
ncbi:MAG: hypothetical protein AAGG08_19640 [Actinomycetota bacterium]